MDNLKQLSESELKVMEIIWSNTPPVSRSDIEKELLKEKDLAPSTIITFLTRLCEKGALSLEKHGRTNLYTPLISRDEYLGSILGEERLNRLNPIKTFMDNGIVVSFGSDAPCTTPDPISWIDRAVNNANKAEAVSVKDALRMCTYNGYYTTFDEKERGSLEAGKIADMAIISDNLYEVPESEIRNIQVLNLYLSGEAYKSADENILKGAMRGITSSSKV